LDWGRAQILTFLLIDQLFGDVSTTNSVGVLIAHMLVYYCVIISNNNNNTEVDPMGTLQKMP